MQISSKDVYRILKDNGIEFLYHANSVLTACHFLRSASLLSRGTVQRRGLTQTSQYSDSTDMRRSIWYDIFMDSVDIHNRIRTANAYGPVQFVISIDILESVYTGALWITKLNPTKWAGKSHEQKWFLDKADLLKNFTVGQFDQMIVVRHCGGELDIRDFLIKIILDDPKLITTAEDVDIYSMAYGALRSASQDADLNIQIERRKCGSGCRCGHYWSGDEGQLFKMFDPKQ